MDRIKKLCLEVLEEYKEEFGTDFVENKKALDKISIIRSKGLKNELAGFITKFIKREIREKKEKEEQMTKDAQLGREDNKMTESKENTLKSTDTTETDQAKNVAKDDPKETSN